MYDLLKVVSLLSDEEKRNKLSQHVESDKLGNVFISGVGIKEAIKLMEENEDGV